MSYEPTIADLPKRLPGESDKIYWKRAGAWVRGDDIRTKGDLSGWATCIFHLNREPEKNAQGVLGQG